MKSSALVLLLSMLANLSFASLTGDTFSTHAYFENMDTAHRESLKISLVGEWTKISQDAVSNGFVDLTFFKNGKFEGHTADGQRVCGKWEVSTDGELIAIHKICEKTGKKLETVLAQIEAADGHTLTMKILGVEGGKQTFIQ